VFQRAEIHRSCAWRCPSNQCFPRQPCACSDRARYLRSEVVEQAFFEIYHFFNTLNEHDKHVKHFVRNINIIGFKFRQAALREVPRSRYRGSGEQNCQFGNFWRRRTLCHAQAKEPIGCCHRQTQQTTRMSAQSNASLAWWRYPSAESAAENWLEVELISSFQ